MQKQYRGFTLIELLVVIAIISILAAILFPVFARARENARRASCQSNLKQIGLGVMQYTQDYDEKFPQYNWGGSTTPLGHGGWANTLQPYLKSVQIFQCPSEPTGAVGMGVTGFADYNYNLFLGWNGAYGSITGQAALTQPTLTVMLADYNANSGYSWFTGVYSGSSGSNCGTTTCTAGLATFPAPAAQRHLDGQNYIFTDGHVKWYKGASPTQSASVYNAVTPGSGTGIVSGNNPTFNPTP